MPKGYWIGQMDVHDAEVYDKYRAANAKPFADYSAKFIVRGGQQSVREGGWRARTVIIEFASLADAIACYESDAYQNAKSIRLPVSEGDLVIVEGYEG
ncbi:DUF1330 domain containing protein [Sulfitobacter noctilucicola]|uniref:Uncharacterized protein (DUF1330 family) n=1 Tax=Sulfitobacter noctilucicola TaxID=1342301 RepID=A0A7W6M921_9RHOB|nr:DUF1330 domain-containing protein [Sulfitobacter noctilucicola]KIN64439.1 DUF1330 domain containing protein [Sulfitobacter noctilucicola]MBB4174402.1 uncharacterized protein (DUF1330 family) [Sulfitobacter noctilucicola]